MVRPFAVIGVLTLAAVTTSSSIEAQQDNVPGRPTVARTYVLNAGAGEAIPVAVHSTGDVIPVTFVGAQTVTLADSAVVAMRQVRQNWEYRQLSVPAGQDVSAALNTAGGEGWEALTVSAGGGGAVTALLKRPR
jgi:hypothetical protein